ncbi:unnamed protein product [Adineta steineri]|uniref:Uncharacterized protein n=1 Tax=Adineta steineri TaxID=433720 RepID=A0A813PZU1_9BILA|nr:unnamed protein product [Adineta steineri]CAF0769376.1 unnamed protein product [Adineta steineri]
MPSFGTSSMGNFWLAFRLLCLICCIITITSYRIDHRPLNEDRNERGVTEWRFRRNRMSAYPTYIRNRVFTHHWTGGENENGDEIPFN